LCADDKLLEQGLDPAVLLEHLRTRGSSSSSKAQQDHADSAALDTQGYSAQDAGRRDAARARCLQAMAGFSDSVLGMIAGTPGTCLVEHGIYVRPAAAMTPAAYGSDRVVVMGDAAHPLRPTGAVARSLQQQHQKLA
jgi:2-polyprenyl-6-methoxyphenol hydroxylase-like FAD-dependent oxidoreductase